MDRYPEVVAKIIEDFLARVKARMPDGEQEEFLKELHSHVYEAYQLSVGDDEVAKILTVLRRIGEPSDVVADRLPRSMLRSGMRMKLPIYIAGGLLMALFGIPLGFSGAGVLLGLLGALAGVVIAFYTVAGSFLFIGALLTLTALVRMWEPALWDRLVALGVMQMDLHPLSWQLGEAFDAISPGGQGLLMILFAAAFVGAGLGMLWVGRHSLRGFRLLTGLGANWMRRLVSQIRSKLQQTRGLMERQPLFTGR